MSSYSMYIDIVAFIFLSIATTIDIIVNKKQTRFKKIIILRFSSKLIRKLEDLTQKHKKAFSALSFFSLIISLPIICLVSYFLIISFLKLQPSIAIVLPSIAGYKYPGPVISVPFFYWIITIFLVILIHETLHAVVAISNGIKVKRYGIIYLLFFPLGAFVDINETQLKATKYTTKIKIYAAGSFGNFLLSLFSLSLSFLLVFVINSFIEDKGVYFESTIPNSPAEKINLSGVIYKINDTEIKNIKDLQSFLLNKSIGEKIKIYTTTGEYELELGEMENKSFIGIKNVKTYFVYKNTNKQVNENLLVIFYHFILLLKWIFIISLGVGLANMLPIIPLDGGLIVKELMIKQFGRKKGNKIAQIISTIFILLIVVSVLLSLKFPLNLF